MDSNIPIVQAQQYSLPINQGNNTLKLSILLTFPTKQGFLNKDTKIILIRTKLSNFEDTSSPPDSEVSFQTTSHTECNGGSKETLCLQDFKPLDYLPEIKSSYQTSLKKNQPSKVEVECRPYLFESEAELLDILKVVKNTVVDENNTVVVSLKMLMNLKVTSGDWVSLFRYCMF